MLGGGSISKYCSGLHCSGSNTAARMHAVRSYNLCEALMHSKKRFRALTPARLHKFKTSTVQFENEVCHRKMTSRYHCAAFVILLNVFAFQTLSWSKMASERTSTPLSGSRQSSSLSSSPMRQVLAKLDNFGSMVTFLHSQVNTYAIR